jgi:hypothetical protein
LSGCHHYSIVASTTTVVASAFPSFLLTLSYIFLRICLFLESTGIVRAWVLA